MVRRALEDAPEVEVASRADLRARLTAHHRRPSGVWLVTYKRADPDRYLPYDAIVEECLCFGWVDSLPRAKDDLRSMLWIAPRKPGSNWSKANKDRVVRREAVGLMTEAGRRLVEIAEADGGWTRLDGVEALEAPPDLAAALEAAPPARAHWDAFPRSVRRGVLEWIVNAKRPETRAARIAETARLSVENVRPLQWRK
jgi:uncharacterized protein YdeI (YjbR/CyaY-like superfamily)